MYGATNNVSGQLEFITTWAMQNIYTFGYNVPTHMHKGGDQNEINACCIFVVKILCRFEVWFPPTLFDLMTYLGIHLVGELEICKHVSTCWCYPIER
jgi:hypothetical protein